MRVDELIERLKEIEDKNQIVTVGFENWATSDYEIFEEDGAVYIFPESI